MKNFKYKSCLDSNGITIILLYTAVSKTKNTQKGHQNDPCLHGVLCNHIIQLT